MHITKAVFNLCPHSKLICFPLLCQVLDDKRNVDTYPRAEWQSAPEVLCMYLVDDSGHPHCNVHNVVHVRLHRKSLVADGNARYFETRAYMTDTASKAEVEGCLHGGDNRTARLAVIDGVSQVGMSFVKRWDSQRFTKDARADQGRCPAGAC